MCVLFVTEGQCSYLCRKLTAGIALSYIYFYIPSPQLPLNFALHNLKSDLSSVKVL